MPFKDKSKMKEYMKKYKKDKAVAIYNKRKRKVKCCCGSVVTFHGLCKHRKSSTHLSYEKVKGKSRGYTEIDTGMHDVDEIPPPQPKYDEKKCKSCNKLYIDHTLKEIMQCKLTDNKKIIEIINQFE